MDSKSIIELLAEIESLFSASTRYDVSSLALKAFDSVTVDLAFTLGKKSAFPPNKLSLTINFLCLVAKAPNTMKAEVQDAFIRLWLEVLELPTTSDNRNTPLSSRNIVLFGESNDPAQTWSRLEHLIGRLLKHGLLLPVELEDQAIQALARGNWPENVTRRLACCVKGVIDTWTVENVQDVNTFQLTDWLADFCGNEMDEFPPL